MPNVADPSEKRTDNGAFQTATTSGAYPPATSAVKTWGWISLWGGVAIWVFGLFLETDIGGTVNLAKQQAQMLTVISGLFVASCGAILIGLGAIHISIRRIAMFYRASQSID